MFKSLFGVLFLSLITGWYKINSFSYSDDLTVENHVLVSVNDKDADDVRIYKEREVTSIGANAFDECTFIKIMISNTVRSVEATFPANVVINYTGALSDISFTIPSDATVYEYACDEGFLNYWKEFIRPNIDGSICSVKKEDYLKMKQLYRSLDNTYVDNDLDRVNKVSDGDGTIKDSVAFLDDYFSESQKSQDHEKEISQSVMITLILVVASFGMTSIGLFYFLKDKNVIK